MQQIGCCAERNHQLSHLSGGVTRSKRFLPCRCANAHTNTEPPLMRVTPPKHRFGPLVSRGRGIQLNLQPHPKEAPKNKKPHLWRLFHLSSGPRVLGGGDRVCEDTPKERGEEAETNGARFRAHTGLPPVQVPGLPPHVDVRP